MAKEVKQWITVNGQHVPIYDGESKQDAFNRAVAKSNEDKKAKDIAKNKAQADKASGKKASIYDREFGVNDKTGLRTNSDTPYKTWGDAINETIDQVCKSDLLNSHKDEIRKYVEDNMQSLVSQDGKEPVSPDNIVVFVNDLANDWMESNFDRLLKERR